MENEISRIEEARPEETRLEARSIETITAEILYLKQTAGTAILEIGRRLLEAKEQLQHGEWLPWLKEKVDFSEASAQRFMRLAKEYPNPSALTDLGASKALILLALEPVERDEFLEQKHEVGGVEKTVSEMSTRELEAAIKAQKKAEEKAAELEDKLQEQQKALEGKDADYNALLSRAQKEVNDLTEELEALKRKKAEVVEVVDTSEIDSLNARLDKKANEVEELKAKLQKKEASLAAAKESEANKQKALEKAVEDGNKERLRANRLQQQLTSAQSSGLSEFKFYFDQCQGNINKMLDIYKEALGRPDPSAAERIRKALQNLEQLFSGIVAGMEDGQE